MSGGSSSPTGPSSSATGYRNRKAAAISITGPATSNSRGTCDEHDLPALDAHAIDACAAGPAGGRGDRLQVLPSGNPAAAGRSTTAVRLLAARADARNAAARNRG